MPFEQRAGVAVDLFSNPAVVTGKAVFISAQASPERMPSSNSLLCPARKSKGVNLFLQCKAQELTVKKVVNKVLNLRIEGAPVS